MCNVTWLHKPDALWSHDDKALGTCSFPSFNTKLLLNPFWLPRVFLIYLFETNRPSALFPRVFPLLLKWVRLQKEPWWMADRHLLCHRLVLGSHFVPFVPRALTCSKELPCCLPCCRSCELPAQPLPAGLLSSVQHKDPHSPRAGHGNTLLTDVCNLRMMQLAEEYCDSLNYPRHKNTIQEKYTS